jgi:hypothetical protein
LEEVVAGASVERVVPRACVEERIISRTTAEEIGTGFAASGRHQVDPVPTVLMVILGDAEQGIVARTAEETVVAGQPDELIVAWSAADHVGPPVHDHHIRPAARDDHIRSVGADE